MGSFAGHVVPGSAMLFVGLVVLLRSLNISYLRCLRANKFWLSIEGIMLVVLGVVAFTMEYLDKLLSHSDAMSHSDHMVILLLLFGAGLVDLLHRHMILDNTAWAMLFPFSISFIGIIFMYHDGDSILETPYHVINAYLLLLAASSLGISLLIGLHSNKRFHMAIKTRPHTTHNPTAAPCKWWHIFCCCFCCKQRSYPDYAVPGIHPMYTNPKVYGTVFPMLWGYFIFLDGCWWWEIAISVYINNVQVPQFTAFVIALHTLAKYVICTLLSLAVIVSVLKIIDAKCCSRGSTRHQESISVELTLFIDDDTSEEHVEKE